MFCAAMVQQIILVLARSCNMNIEIITDANGIEHVIIDKGNGEFTSMPKSVYDEQLAKQEVNQ